MNIICVTHHNKLLKGTRESDTCKLRKLNWRPTLLNFLLLNCVLFYSQRICNFVM